MAAGRDTIVPTVQMSVMPTKRVLWDFLGASGVIIACDDDYIKDLLSLEGKNGYGAENIQPSQHKQTNN